MKYYVTMMENQFNKRIKKFRSDQGGEFKSHEFNNYLNDKGIVRQHSAPHIHQQNGCAKRINQTLMEKAETMRTNSSCPRSWWEFAIDAAVHIYNRTPIQHTNWTTPFENLYGKQPDVKYFRTFGCLAWVFIPKEISYDKGSKAYRFMHKDNSIFIGVKATFNESFFLRSDNDKDKPISPPGINNNWEQEEDSDSGQEDNSTQQNSIRKPKPNHLKDQETLDEMQYFSPDDDDVSEQESDDSNIKREEQEMDIIPATPPRQCSPPPPKTPKKTVRIQPEPTFLRRSTQLKQPVIRPGNVYGDKKATDILKEKDDKLLEEIFGDEPKQQTGSKKSLDQITKDAGNDAVKFLLSKAIKVDEFLPITHKDVIRIKSTNLKAYQEWCTAMMDEVKVLDDREVWELVNCPNN